MHSPWRKRRQHRHRTQEPLSQADPAVLQLLQILIVLMLNLCALGAAGALRTYLPLWPL